MEYQFSDRFSRKVLAVLAKFPDILAQYSNVVKSEYFVSHVHQAICQGIMNIAEHSSFIGPESLEQAVFSLLPDDEDKAVYQKEIDDLYTLDVSDKGFVVDQIVDFAKDAALEQAIIECAHLIDSKKGDYHAEVSEKIEAARMVGRDVLSVGEQPLDNLDVRVNDLVNPDLSTYVSTGSEHLDKCLGGYGAAAGELYVVLGPEKSGKSIVLLNIALGAMRAPNNKKVVLYTLEMSQSRYLSRLDCRIACRSKDFIRKNPEEFKDIVRRKMKMAVGGDLYIKQYPTKTASVLDFKSHLASLRSQGFIPDLVVVDYSNIVKPRNRYNETRREYASIYEDLRALAIEFQVPVWTADQANRSSKGKKLLDSEATSESHEKTTICDFMMSICQTKKEALESKARLFAALSRNEQMNLVMDCKFDKSLALLQTTSLRVPSADDFVDLAELEEEPTDDKSKAVKRHMSRGRSKKK